MLREAAAQGVETVVCTPHLYELDARLVERAHEVHEEVKIELQKAAIPIRLLLGFEVDAAVAVTADDDTLRGLTIEGSERSLLVEMPYNGWPLYLEQTVFRLSAAGFLPILAHPERNERVQHSPDVLTACLKRGRDRSGHGGEPQQYVPQAEPQDVSRAAGSRLVLPPGFGRAFPARIHLDGRAPASRSGQAGLARGAGIADPRQSGPRACRTAAPSRPRGAAFTKSQVQASLIRPFADRAVADRLRHMHASAQALLLASCYLMSLP
jgi:hypothetical protein